MGWILPFSRIFALLSVFAHGKPFYPYQHYPLQSFPHQQKGAFPIPATAAPPPPSPSLKHEIPYISPYARLPVFEFRPLKKGENETTTINGQIPSSSGPNQNQNFEIAVVNGEVGYIWINSGPGANYHPWYPPPPPNQNYPPPPPYPQQPQPYPQQPQPYPQQPQPYPQQPQPFPQPGGAPLKPPPSPPEEEGPFYPGPPEGSVGQEEGSWSSTKNANMTTTQLTNAPPSATTTEPTFTIEPPGGPSSPSYPASPSSSTSDYSSSSTIYPTPSSESSSSTSDYSSSSTTYPTPSSESSSSTSDYSSSSTTYPTPSSESSSSTSDYSSSSTTYPTPSSESSSSTSDYSSSSTTYPTPSSESSSSTSDYSSSSTKYPTPSSESTSSTSDYSSSSTKYPTPSSESSSTTNSSISYPTSTSPPTTDSTYPPPTYSPPTNVTSQPPSHSTSQPCNSNASSTVPCDSTNPLLKYCAKSRGQFPSDDCSTFINCWDDAAIEQDCPGGLLFNAEKEYCDYPSNVDCGGRKPPNPNGTSGGNNGTQNPQCPKDNVLYRNQNDCGAFYICIQGNPLDFKCPDGTAFNDRLKVCDWPYRVDCKGVPILPGPPDEEDYDSNSSTTGQYPSSSIQPSSVSTSQTPISTTYVSPSSSYTSTSQSSSPAPSLSTIGYMTTTGGLYHRRSPAPVVDDSFPKFDPYVVYNSNVKRIPESIVNSGVRCYHKNVFRLTPDCSSVTICQDGSTYIVNCSQGTSFDAYTQACVPSFRARC